MLVWQADESGLESGMVECLAGTAYGTARWHALCRGGMGACCARKPNLAYFKWWERWQSSAIALQYATRWTDPAVIAPTILPASMRGEGPSPEPSRVGLVSMWARTMYPELARVVDTPTRRKGRPPRHTTGGAPRS